MRILLLHNTYQFKGGEDTVFEAEKELLLANGNEVSTLIFDNQSINADSAVSKLLTGLRALYNPKSAKIIKEKINSFQPDVIHIHNFFPIASPSVFYVAQQMNIPVVMTLHNYRLICPSAILYYDNEIYEKSIHKTFPIDAIMKGVYRDSKLQTATLVFMTGIHKILGTWNKKIDKYIALTNFAKAKFLDSSLNAGEGRFAVKPNFTGDLGLGPEEREDYFLFIGRLTEEKGIKVLMEAAKQGNFKVKILGDGPYKEEVVAESEKNENIVFMGFQGRETVINELKNCKALIFPSTWYEGMPMVILEAFSVGTPVIGSRLGGAQEVIEDQYNGLHFEPGNAGDLLAKIELLNESSETRAQLSKNARKSYEEKYTPAKNYEFLMDIYKDIIEKKQRSKH
ncbi:glycosyltransferase family 4 protein [Flexithrix dorotheae]|uniref:glycosyltransferase family 4 protein n=1 Tax=Flexithrix dorotheae TaxID=70993 RepID=UPI000365E106|nr:glycosyltransferase family 4 protein [Flexithrix dorotheae]